MPDQLLREPPRVRETIAQVGGAGWLLLGQLQAAFCFGCRALGHQASNFPKKCVFFYNAAFVDTAETDGDPLKLA